MLLTGSDPALTAMAARPHLKAKSASLLGGPVSGQLEKY